MVPHLAVVEGGFTKVTERFLLSQPGILDASVWYAGGTLQAHVTLDDNYGWTERTLKVACARELGLEHTPGTFTILLGRMRVA